MSIAKLRYTTNVGRICEHIGRNVKYCAHINQESSSFQKPWPPPSLSPFNAHINQESSSFQKPWPPPSLSPFNAHWTQGALWAAQLNILLGRGWETSKTRQCTVLPFRCQNLSFGMHQLRCLPKALNPILRYEIPLFRVSRCTNIPGSFDVAFFDVPDFPRLLLVGVRLAE